MTDVVSAAAALGALVDQARRERLTVPCRTGSLATTSRWTDDDRAAQRRAAAACHDCPLFLPCRSHGRAHPREAGVYGGLTYTDRNPGPGRPKTTPRTDVK